MRLDAFLDGLARIDLGSADDRPPRDHVRAAAGLLAQGVTDPEFFLDLLERWVGLAEEAPDFVDRSPVWRQPAYKVQLVFWPPDYSMGAHEHKHWTVSGILNHALTMTTYETDAVARGRLEMRNQFTVSAGQAGHIYEYGVHRPMNLSDQWASSLHIFADGDTGRMASWLGLADPVAPPPSDKARPGAGLDDAVRRIAELQALEEQWERAPTAAQWNLAGCLAHLSQSRSPRARALLERAFELGDLATRRAAAERALARDRELGERWMREVIEATALAEACLADPDWVAAARALAERAEEPAPAPG